MSYSLDFGSCFTFILLKFKPKYCFKKILHKEKLHFLVSFSFETQFEVHQNDPEQVFEGDIFDENLAIPQWRTLDQHCIYSLQCGLLELGHLEEDCPITKDSQVFWQTDQ